jgi:hypothetical protein
MIITLHTLAQTYNLLPSEALGRATTFDLFVLDNYSRFMRHQEQKQSAKPGEAPPTPKLTQAKMKEMIERAKNFVPPKERNKGANSGIKSN